MSSNLPPGVSQYMLDSYFEDKIEDAIEYWMGCVMDPILLSFDWDTVLSHLFYEWYDTIQDYYEPEYGDSDYYEEEQHYA